MRSPIAAHVVHVTATPPTPFLSFLFSSCLPLRRLISGMHSSITAHVVNDYLIDEATQTWGPNLEMFKWRLGNPAVKDRCAEGGHVVCCAVGGSAV